MTLSTSKLTNNKFRVNIINKGIYDSTTTAPNEHPYFGIREISIKGSS